ncbi:hypothetical protein EF68_000921 [Salmonella enterica subsp. enterica]|nr:hypothetical protein [Salmonella enterica subsp. enterica serovar Fischerstrasse]EDX0372343.1 hypothetical protein [Salmonella enterica]EDY6794952.1 hypothetical protein [Salmonella enterica subsp. enterica serovar Umbadah]HDC2224282.1 hypothetical protein [Salmonella enterica]
MAFETDVESHTAMTLWRLVSTLDTAILSLIGENNISEDQERYISWDGSG